LPRYKTCGGGLVRRAVELLPADVQRVIERNCVIAELHLLDRGAVDHVLACADAGRELVARLVQLRVDLDRLERRRIGRVCRAGGGSGVRSRAGRTFGRVCCRHASKRQGNG